MANVETVPTVNVDELREMLDRGEPVTVLDVRSAGSRAEWSVPGSLHVEASEALKSGRPEVLDTVPLPGGRPVVAVCNAGNTSRIAARYLRSRGVPAFSLAGGMRAWSLAWNEAEVPLPPRGAPQTAATRVLQLRRTGKGCLSYLVGARGQAVAVDPSLDADLYEKLAEDAGWRITHVVETHVHADHLSRARALAQRTGAELHLPAQRRVSFAFTPVEEGDVVAFGGDRLVALRVPGHTGESTAYLLEGRALFTGDTLFASAVGRPDLEGGSDEARPRARELYRSLQRLLALPPELVVLPAHTSRPVAFDGTPVAVPLEEARRSIVALGSTETQFVEAVISRIPPTPPNHRTILELNEAGRLPEGDPTELEAGANRCAVS